MAWDAEVAVVGAGAAGLTLAHRLATLPSPLRVLLVGAPDGPLRAPERTWCWWEEPGGELDGALAARWSRVRVHGTDGRPLDRELAPFVYKMLRSRDFERWVAARLDAAPSVRRVEAVVDEVRDDAGGAVVRGVCAKGRPVVWRARWAFDSRPAAALPPARTTLLQHFRGWFVRCDAPALNPAVAELMDFRTPQPDRGLSFGYVLPLSDREALVEYTEFSPAVLDDAAYDAALRHYTGAVLRLPRFRVLSTEQGVIPMTDGRFPRRAGAAVFRIGTAGGATRPATGYTFAAVRRQSRAVAAAFAAGRRPVPPAPYPARALAMDAAMLRALATGRVAGADVFTGLFRHVPAERLLRFLDGRTGPAEDVMVGVRTPVAPMLRTVAELPWLRWRTDRSRQPAPLGRER
ncbi:lycopene cyclase family protein [Streptomyces sp. Rer75]|uniref:lycopene cyclase family protein n=1 Tax=Streptomyces sp. Rer75 TaxID=2750011 RepID=UPI0015CFEE00|nr:lycopene cyclase family protein [Streptomyces sp. Rer75]QLH20147.1 lycopene cyclase [Streptomyces sp. Rer75]